MKKRMRTSKHEEVEEFSAYELETAEFLLQIGQLFAEPDSRPRVVPLWRARRFRSAIVANPICEVERPSPSTPLSFPTSESDHNSKPSKRKTTKTMRTEILKKHVSELTKEREILTMKKKRATELHEVQEMINVQLKQLKESPAEERLIPKEGNLDLNLSLGSCVEQAEPTVFVPTCSAPKEDEKEEQTPIKVYGPDPYIINNQTAQVNPIMEKSKDPVVPMPPSFSSSGVCVGTLKSSNPHGIPDLNIPLEEDIEMDFPQ